MALGLAVVLTADNRSFADDDDGNEPEFSDPTDIDNKYLPLAKFDRCELVERTFDYFGQSDEGTVYYFGEDVDDYENGEIVGHDGEWRYGRDTNKLGVLMPHNPKIGDTWKPEQVPGITQEDAKLVNKRDKKTIGGTTYEDVLRVREFQKPGNETEHKLYARGVGNISELPPDGRVDLVDCE